MSFIRLRPNDTTRPFVAVLCSVPLLGEAMGSVLDFAEVRTFSERGGDVDGLLRWLRPDALIVDSDAGALEATTFALEHDLPLVHISIRDRALRLFRNGEWEVVGNGEGPTPEAVRNVIAGTLFARQAR
jgi:hypothetical protein